TSDLPAMRKRKVAVLGATGTVGQRFIGLLQGHPWFEISALTTSDAKAGKRYGDVTPWHWSGEMPANAAGMTLQPTSADLDAEICFSALPADAAEQWEAALAKTGHHVFSNVKTHRMDDDVPLLIAEVNAEHMHALEVQRRKRGWSGSIVTNGNCSAIGFALAAAPLHKTFGIERAVVTTMQALSGAGYPGVASLDALDNVVPFIARDTERGMAAIVGRVREDPAMGIKYVVLTHNTIRGAAGASILNAELLAAEGCLGN